KRKRTGEEQTDKNRLAKHSLQTFIISNIRVPVVFCLVELYSQLAGNAFPLRWENIPNKLGTLSQRGGTKSRACM
ncbi:hypothetical protein, partial [uncultured Bacteroides sp.]|uniref:hypothetical protein n=1 Tax=uncultured Bacteroides sp. TaxID=162156 RepID=UPI002607EDCE